MQRQERRPNWPALGLATALALAVTTGVPALMQAGNAAAPHVDGLAAARHAPATEVSIEPRRIEVVASRESNNVSRWFSVVGTKRAS